MKLEEGYLKKETIGCRRTGRRMLTNAENKKNKKSPRPKEEEKEVPKWEKPPELPF